MEVDSNNDLTGYAINKAVGSASPSGGILSGTSWWTSSYSSGFGQSQEASYATIYNINANHAHTISSNDIETRSTNFTYRIWKRIS